MSNPVLHLLDPSNGLDLSSLGVQHIPSGSYRFVNAQSRGCLSATAPAEVSSPNDAFPLISAWRAMLSDGTARTHQIWNVIQTPVTNKSISSTKTVRPAFQNAMPTTPAPTFIIESYDLSASSGAGYALRLDLKEERVIITDATIHSVLDTTPNGLPLPLPRFGAVTTPPVPPGSITAPKLAIRTLVASPAGSATSSFLFIRSHLSSRFWLYNPATMLFIGQPVTMLAHPETDFKGAPIVAGDLHKYFLDTRAYVAQKKSQKGWTSDMSKALWDAFVKEMDWWMWELAHVDFGPQKGSYRILHHTTLLALDTPDHTIQHGTTLLTESTWRGQRSISPSAKTLNYTNISTAATTKINPLSRSQVWNILPQADTGKGTIVYTISNFSKSTALLTSGTRTLSMDTHTKETHWRLISIPPSATAPATAPAPATYLIYETDTGSLLALSPFDNSIVSVASGLHAPELTSDIEKNEIDEDVLLTWILKNRELFWANWEWLAWKVIQESWGPQDGVYKIVDFTSSKFLDVSPNIYTDPALVNLSSLVIPTLGTSWWNLKAAIADDGTIYYTVHNYRSGAALDLGGTTRTDIVARRLGTPAGERWAIIRGDENAAEFDFLKVEKPGTALATSDAGISLVPLNKATGTWSLQKIEFQITPGTYFLVNVASNLFLSANTFLPNKPLLVRAYKANDTEQAWNVSAQPGSSDSFFIGTSQGSVSASVPPKNSVWASSGNPDEMFVITADNNQPRSGWLFTKQEQSNAYKVHDGDGNLLSVIKGHDSQGMVVLKADNGTDSQLWRAVSINIPPPSVPIVIPSTPPANVPDGLYRIINQHTKLNLVLGKEVKLGTPDHLLSLVGLDLRAKAQSYSPYELWYISRNRDPLLAAQDQTYLIQSFASALYIDQSDPEAKQRASGLTCWAMARQPLYPTQQWMFSQLSAFSFAIASCATGCLLDVDSSNLVSTPQLSASPAPTQLWQLSSVAAPLTSGNYKIFNIYTQTAMSVSSSTPSIVCAQYGALGPVAPEWRLTALSDGLYRIESLNGLSCLHADFSAEVSLRPREQGLESRWKLRPSSKGGFVVENAANGLVLTLKGGSAEVNASMQLQADHDIPWQKFAFERLDVPARSFDDVGSDKVAFGMYKISNARSHSALAFPSGTLAIGTRPACNITLSATAVSTTASSSWTIIPSATGYYSLQQSTLSLGHGVFDPSDSRAEFPVALSDGFDATRWKFLKSDVSGTYRIVNKYTGKLLAEDDNGMVICGVDDGASLGQQWSLSSTTPPSTSAPPQANVPPLCKEILIQNSMFQFINSKTAWCITSISFPSLPAAVSPRDLEPFSVDGRLQVWVVEQNRDGWYIIKSFPFGNALGAGDSGSLVYVANDSSSSFQWKFIQDAKATTIRCVNRRFPASVLSAQEGSGSLELAADNSGPLQRWTMLRTSGTSTDTGIAQGVYTMTLYTKPTVSSAIAEIKSSEAKSQDDAAVAKKLNLAQHSVANLSVTLGSNFPPPPLPTGVDTTAIQTQLAPSDWNDSLAVTTIAANVLAFVYSASLPTSMLLRSAAGGTVTNTTTAPELSFDTASTKIATIVRDLVQKSLQPNSVSDLDITTAAQAITQISKSITILTDISPQHVQSLILSLGTEMLSILSDSLPKPSSTTNPSTTSSTLTLNTPVSVAAAPSLSQDVSQYWMLETISSTPGFYTLSHLTTKQYVVFGTAVGTPSPPIVTVQMQFPGPEGFWKVVSQRMGGYALINSSHPKQALCLLSGTTQIGCLAYVADLQPGYSQQRWQLTRSGYYFQNQGENNRVRAASVDDTGNEVRLAPYRLFSQASLLDGARADAYFIWHLVKVDKGYQFVNEHTRSYLHNTGSNGDTVSAAATSAGDSAIWKLAKINENVIWMQCQDHGRWLALKDANSDSLCLQDPGNKELWKGWQFVSVTRTERGTLMSLPRCALLPPIPQDQSLVYSVDPTSLNLVQQHYQPDNAYQRFRSVTFGDSTAYINEATKRVLKHPASTTDIADIDTDCWFVGIEGSIKTVFKGGTAVFQRIIKDTGDLPTAPLSCRIQIGVGISSPNRVLGINAAGEPKIVPLDVLDSSQLWSYVDWGLGRFIVHVLTSKLLSTANGMTVTLGPGGKYTQEAMWLMDVSDTNVPDSPSVNGFFKLHPAIQTGILLSLQPHDQTVSEFGVTPILSPTGDFGCRFITTSSSFNFTSRRKMLLTFLKSYLPVFVHDKGAPLPADVESYFSHSILVDKTHPTLPPRSYPPLPTSENGDWVLHTSLSVSDGKSATAYVVVRQTTEPTYINYTDFVVWLFYPPSSPVDTIAGWTSITMRVSNDSRLLDSVYFPDGKHGWVYNLDMNFSRSVDTKANPLRIIKGTSNGAKLHIYVPPDLSITPFFPTKTVDSDIIDQTKWGLTFDAGGKTQLLEADMLRDDGQGSRPVRPQWMDYIGRWVDSSGSRAVGPM